MQCTFIISIKIKHLYFFICDICLYGIDSKCFSLPLLIHVIFKSFINDQLYFPHSYYRLQSAPALLRFQVLEKIALRKNLEVKFTLVEIALVGDIQHPSFMNLKSDSTTVDQKCARM